MPELDAQQIEELLHKDLVKLNAAHRDCQAIGVQILATLTVGHQGHFSCCGAAALVCSLNLVLKRLPPEMQQDLAASLTLMAARYSKHLTIQALPIPSHELH